MLFAKVTNPEHGYDHDQKKLTELDKDTYYQVTYVSMGQSSTSFRINGFNGGFNSVNFTFYKKNAKGEYVEHNIFRDPEYNPYL